MNNVLSKMVATLFILLFMSTIAIAGHHGCIQNADGDNSDSCCKAMNLTAEQTAKMNELRATCRQEILPLVTNLKEKKSALIALIGNNSPKTDMDKVLDEINAVKVRIQKVRLSNLLKIRQMLDEKQKELFDTTCLKGFMDSGHGCDQCDHSQVGHEGCPKNQKPGPSEKIGCSKPCTLPQKDHCMGKTS